jgi:FkbM family methyltransferase
LKITAGLAGVLYQVSAKVYLSAVRGVLGQKVNSFVLQMALRGRGFNNCCDMDTSGESLFLERLAKTSPKLCIDVGANVGQYSRALLEVSEATVFAFEPLPAAFLELERIGGQSERRFRAYNLAVGNSKGRARLHFGDEKSEFASLSIEVNQIDYVGQENTSFVNVEVGKLDDYMTEFEAISQEVDLLKIDVEGYEAEVLAGASLLIKQMRPRFVQLEFNHHQLFRGQSFLSLASYLPGYKVFQLLPFKLGMAERVVSDTYTNIFAYSNFVFVRGDIELP